MKENTIEVRIQKYFDKKVELQSILLELIESLDDYIKTVNFNYLIDFLKSKEIEKNFKEFPSLIIKYS